MIRITRPVDFPWLDGRFWEVPHQLGPEVAICRVDVPPDVIVPPETVGKAELVRATRMRDRVEALRFLASHAVLRAVLASAVGRTRSQLALTVDGLGKPRLAGGLIRFNMSRSGPTVLIGISEAREIGVDVEMDREVPCQEGLAREHLSSFEYEAWWADTALSREVTFLKLWTRKEACVKAAGMGLAMRLGSVEVGIGADRSPLSFTFRSGLHDWSGQVVSLPMPPRLFAAAAVITS